MPTNADDRYVYTPGNARIFDTLGLDGDTYGIALRSVRELLGNIRGKMLLDFGSGTGRSAAFLRALGARHVYGVDHDRNMVNVAVAKGLEDVTFMHIDDVIPLPDASVDGAASVNVFIEVRTLSAMRQICAEVYRVLRPNGSFIMASSSPMAFGHTFRSFSYPSKERLQSGDLTTCIITAPDGQFSIEDTYWAEDDYVGALAQAGFTVATIEYPRPPSPSAWSTDEATIPPYIVIEATKD
jgi:SAM-dependent methyltransferase